MKQPIRSKVVLIQGNLLKGIDNKTIIFVIFFTMGNFFGNLFYIVILKLILGPSKRLVPQIELQPNSLQYPLINNLDLIQHIIGRQVDVSNGI